MDEKTETQPSEEQIAAAMAEAQRLMADMDHDAQMLAKFAQAMQAAPPDYYSVPDRILTPGQQRKRAAAKRARKARKKNRKRK